MTLHNLDVAIALAVVMLGVSLLITILTQAVATGLCTRGRTLRESLAVLFKNVYPEGAALAETIANDVLTHELISDSAVSASFNTIFFLRNYCLASAVRVEEVIGILNLMALRQQNSDKANVMRELVRRARQTLTPEIDAVTQQAVAVVEKLQGAANGGQQDNAGKRVSTSISVDRLLQDIPPAAEIFLPPDSMKAWFNSAMDRASQKFILKTRLITIVCSLIVAFALHLDTFRFLSQVSDDPELRAGLVSASQAMEKHAARVLEPIEKPKPGSPETQEVHVPAIYRQALKETVTKLKNPAALKKAAANIPHLNNREAGERWLRDSMENDPKTQEAVTQYQSAVEGGLQSDTDRLLDNAASIKGSLDYAGFKVIPDPYHSWDFWPATKTWWRLDNLHFWGILFSAGLLSLGAPFWFNALKTLSSLRPVVASKAEQEQQAG
jgi:hypothetical protein